MKTLNLELPFTFLESNKYNTQEFNNNLREVLKTQFTEKQTYHYNEDKDVGGNVSYMLKVDDQLHRLIKIASAFQSVPMSVLAGQSIVDYVGLGSDNHS